LLYAGSERGFYISYNGGAQWNKLQLNLPVVPILDLAIHEQDLIAATAGRAFWILDDISALQQSSELNASTAFKLFEPKPAYHYSGARFSAENDNTDATMGANPLQGVIIDYYLPEAADSNLLKLEITDLNGAVVKTYRSKKEEKAKSAASTSTPLLLPAEKGLNRFAWDLSGEDLGPAVPSVLVLSGYSGYLQAPGKYKAKLTYKGKELATNLEVLQDPNLKVTAADWAEQQQYLARVGKDLNEVYTTINQLLNVKNK